MVGESYGIALELALFMCKEASKCTVGVKINTDGTGNCISLLCAHGIEVCQPLGFPVIRKLGFDLWAINVREVFDLKHSSREPCLTIQLQGPGRWLGQ